MTRQTIPSQTSSEVHVQGHNALNLLCLEDLQEAPTEMRRSERQRDKTAKRKEIKARKTAGITSESDADAETTEKRIQIECYPCDARGRRSWALRGCGEKSRFQLRSRRTAPNLVFRA